MLRRRHDVMAHVHAFGLVAPAAAGREAVTYWLRYSLVSSQHSNGSEI